MSLRSTTSKSRKRLATGLVAGLAVLALTACTSNSDGDSNSNDNASAPAAAPAGANDETGDTVVIVPQK